MKTLIVEDDFTSRVLLQEVLKRDGTVHIAVNGKEAVDAVRAAMDAGEPYDLICLDIMMPEMDGYEALKEIRAIEESRGIRSPGRHQGLHDYSTEWHEECRSGVQRVVRRLPVEAHREGEASGTAARVRVDRMKLHLRTIFGTWLRGRGPSVPTEESSSLGVLGYVIEELRNLNFNTPKATSLASVGS